MEALRRVATLAQPALSQAGATSLDLGCGTGLFADHVGVRSLIGVDVSDTLHDIFALPFAACSTDTIVSLFVIDDYPSEQKAVFFNHVFALLKPGSHCFFVAYAPHDERMGTRRGAITKTAQGDFEVYLEDVPSYQDRLQQCGFLVEQTELITADGFFRVGAQLDELQRAFIVMVGQKP